MTRAEAIGLLVEAELLALGDAERASLLLGAWSLDEEDDDYAALPESLRAEMRRCEEPDGTSAPHYEALLRIALRHRFVGVRNEYLSSRLATLGKATTVTGEVEALEPCPCCMHRTLSERGGYAICPVCFWEDDGSCELDRVSAPNRMTLREGRESFARLGAVSEDAVAHVLPDGALRYERDEAGS